jgi:aryl-alcohol dehydrogenase-like predicted oxidoreductase
MQYRTLGRTGLRVSEIGFGGAVVGIANYIEAWDPGREAEQESVVRALERGLELGYNYLDTAPGYGDGTSERVFGKVVGRRREECVVATKTSARDPEGIRRSVERSLRNLCTETLDVLQFHGGWYPPEDVAKILEQGGLETYEALRQEGKVRFLGFTAEGPSGGVTQLIGTGRFDVMQVRYNVLYQHTCDHVNSAGIIRDAEARGMGIVTMRTLTSGTFQKLMRSAFPTEMAGADLDRFCLNYVLSNPLIDVALVGMRRVEEVESNNRLSDDVESRLDLAELHVRFV